MCVKKAWISKFGFKNAKLVTLHATSDCMRPPLLGRGNCCVTRPGIAPPWLSEEIRTIRFAVFLQLLAYYLILLDLQLINFPRACTISREAPSRFPHFLQPWLWTTHLFTKNEWYLITKKELTSKEQKQQLMLLDSSKIRSLLYLEQQFFNLSLTRPPK